ncbi:hypothetical protein SASPL_136687 [Salvia splendens]|uniref:Telomere repeat-binding protein 1-6-like ubiquitin-like domain-containing protein n=1 Tax=Salvia splendens TaxID=180675 RepID=A0A8X8X1R3_SALSN|nr:hypothetical protein SASPL_136687 [Salvia splendens]
MNGVFTSAAVRFHIRMVRATSAASSGQSVLSSFALSFSSQHKSQKHNKLIPIVSSFLSQRPHLNSHIALNSLNSPNFQTYAAVLGVLVDYKWFGDAEEIRILMVKSCDTEADARLALAILREMNDNGFRIHLLCYNVLLMSLARFVMIDDMKSVYWEMLLEDRVSPNVYTFNTMINAYCKLGNVKEAERYLCMILKAGLGPDAHTFTSFILGHCQIKDIDSATKVFMTMGCQRNEVSYNNLMHGLCEVGRVDEARKLFLQMKDDHCFPNVRTYTILIDALCSSDRRLDALSLFEEMKEKGCKPNVHTYTVIINGACRDGMFDDARKLLGTMLDNSLIPSVVTYNALINGYCKKGKVDAAFEIFNLMKSNNSTPNVRTYNELISGFSEQKQVHKAMALLGKMLEQKLSPDLVTFNLLVYGQCKQGDIDSAFRLLRLMEENSIVPDQCTYGPIIVALCDKGSVDKALDIFESLKGMGIKANEVTYTALISGFCNAEKVDFALQLFRRMSTEGFLPNSYTYNVVIKGLCKVNKLSEALSYLEKMLDIGMKPTIVTYSIVIEQMLKEFEFDRAYKVLNHMVAMGCKPDVCTYTSFLLAYCNQGMLKEAEDVKAKMKEEEVRPDLMAFTVLIDGYGRSGFLNLAFSTFKSMIAAGCEPSDYTYSVLIKHLSQEKLVDRRDGVDQEFKPISGSVNIADIWKIMEHDTALKLFENMEKYGCAPNIKTYNALITGLCRERRFEEAWRLVDHLKQRGMSLNEDMYNKLVDCCCNLKMYKEAVDLINVMLTHELLPHIESYKLLVCGLYNEGSDEKAKQTFCRLLHIGYNYDEVVWKVLIDGLMRMGFVKECSELVGVMERSGNGVKSFYQNRKRIYTQLRCLQAPIKRRKLFDHMSTIANDQQASSNSISNSPEKGVCMDKSNLGIIDWCIKPSTTVEGHKKGKDPHGDGVKSFYQNRKRIYTQERCLQAPIKKRKLFDHSSTVAHDQQASMKFIIKSFKRTLMEAITAILGHGVRAGAVLQRKKVRDDKRTLQQAGISQNSDLDTLDEELMRSPVTPMVDSGISNASVDSPFISEVELYVEAVERLRTGRWRDDKMGAFEHADHRMYVDLKDKWKTLVHTAGLSLHRRRGELGPQDLLDLRTPIGRNSLALRNPLELWILTRRRWNLTLTAVVYVLYRST